MEALLNEALNATVTATALIVIGGLIVLLMYSVANYAIAIFKAK